MPSGGPGCSERYRIVKIEDYLNLLNNIYLLCSNLDRWDFYPNDEELKQIDTIFEKDFKIPCNFTMTADPFKPKANYNRNVQQAQPRLNPQTTEFCTKLGIDDPLEKLIGKPVILTAPVVNPDEINLEDEDEDDDGGAQSQHPTQGENNDLFFVDTKPQKRNKMNLPLPQKEVEEEPPLHMEKEPTVSVSLNESTLEVNPKEPDQDVPCVKKFKRRNQDLYTDQENST